MSDARRSVQLYAQVKQQQARITELEAELAAQTNVAENCKKLLLSVTKNGRGWMERALAADSELAAAQATIASVKSIPQIAIMPMGEDAYGYYVDAYLLADYLADTSTAAYDRAIREAKAGALEVTDARTETAAQAMFKRVGLTRATTHGPTWCATTRAGQGSGAMMPVKFSTPSAPRRFVSAGTTNDRTRHPRRAGPDLTLRSPDTTKTPPTSSEVGGVSGWGWYER